MQQLIDIVLKTLIQYAEGHGFGSGWTAAITLGVILIGMGIVYLLFRCLIILFQQARPILAWLLRRCGWGRQAATYTFLQITFPAETKKSAYATEQLHILMRGLAEHGGFRKRLAGYKTLYSLELVATKEKGIRYIVMVATSEADVVKRTLLSFLPGIKVSEVDDYARKLSGLMAGVVELKLSGDFVLPLAANKSPEDHDTIAYLTGQMRRLADKEVAAFQIVVTPVFRHTHHNVLRRVRAMQHRIALGRELSTELDSYRVNPRKLILKVLFAPFWLLGVVIEGIISVFETPSTGGVSSPANGEKKRQASDPFEQELGRIIKGKLDQQLFEVSIRLLVASPEAEAINSRLSAMISSLEMFTSPHQSIRLRKAIPLFSPEEKYLPRFRERSLSPHRISQPTILSSSELADLYHFPDTNVTKTEGLAKSRSRDLPTPLSLKRDQDQFDVVVGRNEFDGELKPIGVTLEQRQRHTYVIGKTGTGKSTLLMGSIYQDMVNGKGLAVFDPHGDMFRELLEIVPEHRRKDVVVFDPSDRDYPIGLNILDPGIAFDNEDDRQEWITSTVISVFAKLADKKQWGPRMEHILRNVTLTALQTPQPSLYTLQRLLTDKSYQTSVAKTLKDPVLKQFWDKEFKLLGSMQMSSVTAPLTHRLGRFITAKMSRHILLQKESTVRIADIMNEGKILLVNLSKGDIGEDQSFFFGTILTSFIWMAAYQRTKIPEKKRRDFFVYVDEFQNFATPQFGAITSEGRKFHIALIVSHQNIAQMEDKDLVKVVAGNAATIVCLKANPEDEAFILPYMQPEVEKGDIVNLAPYHFYMKVTGGESEEAFSGQTVPLEVISCDEVKDEVIALSREQYGRSKETVEAYMKELFQEEKPPSGKVTVTRKPQTEGVRP